MNKDFRANLLLLKQLAFTLAETLIVMGIIGVVAALTLPNLNSSTGDKEKVTKVKKIYTNLQDAIGRAEAVYGPVDEWFVNDGDDNDKRAKRAFDRITEFLKYSKACTITECEAVFDKGGTSGGDSWSTAKYNVILADGATVGFYTNTMTTQPFKILIDIDGLNKGPNKACKDYFSFVYDGTRKILTYDLQGIQYNYRASSLSSSHCTAWVIVNGNMDYLKVGNDGKCPDGKTVLDWTTNTTCK